MSELQDLLSHLFKPSIHFVQADDGKWFVDIHFVPTLTSKDGETITEEAYSFDGAVDIVTQALREYKENYQ